MDKKTSYDIRKAEKNELEFQIARKREELDEFASFKANLRGRTHPEEYSNFERDYTWDILYKSNIRRLFLVRHNDKLIGGMNTNDFNGNLIQTSVVNIQSELNGGTFLTWNTIKWAMQMKKNTFDLGGANPIPSSLKERGIDFFKSKWTNRKFHHFIFLKIRNRKKKKITTAVLQLGIISTKVKKIFKDQ